MARNLKTGWVIIATSGQTVDGREIKREWLEDFAQHYNPNLYKAKLWPDHYRFYCGGSVLALKTEPAVEPDLEGELNLFAILEPNDWMIEANRAGQYTHCSIEVTEDFMGKGFAYLAGLGVTDEPASVGTQELKFNRADGSGKTHVVAGRAINVYANSDSKPAGPKALFQRLFGATPELPPTNEPEDDDMPLTPEQKTELLDELRGDLKTMFADIKNEHKPGDGTPAPAKPPTEPAAPPAEGDLPAQFAALQADNKAMKEGIEKLLTEFAALQTTPAGGTKPPEGNNSDEVEVI